MGQVYYDCTAIATVQLLQLKYCSGYRSEGPPARLLVYIYLSESFSKKSCNFSLFTPPCLARAVSKNGDLGPKSCVHNPEIHLLSKMVYWLPLKGNSQCFLGAGNKEVARGRGFIDRGNFRKTFSN